jgi:hypothetical protein
MTQRSSCNRSGRRSRLDPSCTEGPQGLHRNDGRFGGNAHIVGSLTERNGATKVASSDHAGACLANDALLRSCTGITRRGHPNQGRRGRVPGDGAALAAAKGREETSSAGVMMSELLPETMTHVGATYQITRINSSHSVIERS